MRITKVTLTAFRGVSSSLDLCFGKSGKNVLVYGENGSAKSSFAHALEYLFAPEARADQAILGHRNLFTTDSPEIRVAFRGGRAGGAFSESLAWTHASGKPAPSWLLMSAARSAFLDHRKLLMLSDRSHGDLSTRFFLTAVEHLFGSLPVGASSEAVSTLWRKAQDAAQAYRLARTSSAAGGVARTTAQYKAIEHSVNLLNQALDAYLLPVGDARAHLVREAERLLERFEGHGLAIDLRFDHLTFNRTDGSFGGGALSPTVSYCGKALGHDTGGVWVSTHHEVLNEARLTATALALFFAAVRLQDEIPYTPGAGDPDEPARLLVLDDILIGLDYEHRIPVLEIIREEFAREGRYQVVLLTHDRIWFDVCRLQLEGKDWQTVELYSGRRRGPGGSDFPMRKESSADLLERALMFLDEYHEPPAAANYARSAVEAALRHICEKRHVAVPFRSDPQKHSAEEFIDALRGEKLRKGSSWHLIPLRDQAELRALRSTVLNPLSHFNPTTVTGSEIRRAIAVAEKLNKLAQHIKANGD